MYSLPHVQILSVVYSHLDVSVVLDIWQGSLEELLHANQ